ncbi:MAG: acyl-ACP--UDP-N-acetylglucosamine O-acyltransferase [Proteobacteria bacterium]|nr:acyl-ACP--UDP-N-acetylglucosamine O-acyltransferase [Pseudomonadota bacterium]
MIDPTAKIHATAIIEEGAILKKNVSVGPYCIIGSKVVLEENVTLKSHININGDTVVGKGTIIYPFASLGEDPQDLKFEGEDSKTIIGENCKIREYVTIQKGTHGGNMLTTVGNNCLLMVGVHIAHDCIVGNNVVMANYVSLGGHVTVEDNAILGGLSAVQQFTRIGKGAMIGGMCGIGKDVIPYGTTMNERAHLAGLNLIGLKRKGFSNKDILDLQEKFKAVFESSDDDFKTLIENHLSQSDNPLVQELKAFLCADSKRRFCMPRK